MLFLGHMLKHVLRHVPVRHVLEHVTGHMLENEPKHVPDRHVLVRHVLGLIFFCSNLFLMLNLFSLFF